MAKGKGILAADESDSTCAKRFDKYDIPKTAEMRRLWRELLFTTPEIEKGLSGIILYDETLRQRTSAGVPFAEYLVSRGILAGIKVDQKTEPLKNSPEEEVTKGLDGLSARLAEYVKLGATFTKWRAVIRIGEGLPTAECINENARRLAAYARECQKEGLVPILEPEVLLDGTHTLARSEAVLTETLRSVFNEAQKAGADLSGLILKSSMALPGKESPPQGSGQAGSGVTPQEIAEATLRALVASVPPEVAGIVFLSGGQTPEEATIRLNAIAQLAQEKKAPWPISFSYSRALQDLVLKEWAGNEATRKKAQQVFTKRVSETAAASRGEYAAR